MCVAVGVRVGQSVSGGLGGATAEPDAPTLQPDTVVFVGVGVGVDVDVSVGVAVNLGVFVGVRVRVGVAVAPDTDVFVGVAVNLGVFVGVRVRVGVAVDDVPLSLNAIFTSTFARCGSGLVEIPLNSMYCFRVLSLSHAESL